MKSSGNLIAFGAEGGEHEIDAFDFSLPALSEKDAIATVLPMCPGQSLLSSTEAAGRVS